MPAHCAQPPANGWVSLRCPALNRCRAWRVGTGRAASSCAFSDTASLAIERAFSVPEEAALTEPFPRVSDSWVRRFTLAVILIAHGSYRHVIELLRDLFGLSLSIGTIHSWVMDAAQCATARNRAQDLSGVRVGLHDEIFQGNQPVLAGIDAASTYCYLLEGVEHRDADTWGVHLLDAAKQGLNPEYTVADAGNGLRAGQTAAWGDKPCHGDVFHIRQQCEALTNVLSRLVHGCASKREALEHQMCVAKEDGDGRILSASLGRARQAESQAHELARDVKTLTGWLGHDVLSLAGPEFGERQAMFDFIVEQLRLGEPQAAHWIRPVRLALQRQRDAVLGFARVLDDKLAAIAQRRDTPLYWVRQVCRLHRKKPTSTVYWQRWSQLYTPSCEDASSRSPPTCVLSDARYAPVELDGREPELEAAQIHFFLRHHLGAAYLSLLQFFLNHRVFMRSRRVERVGKTPCEMLTGRAHLHWLDLLGFKPQVPA